MAAPESVSQSGSSCSAAARVVKKFFVDLMEGIQDPDKLAVELYANDVFVRTTRDQVTQITLTREQKNTVLLAAVESQILINPSSFEVFLCALRGRRTLDSLCRRMDEAYGKLNRVEPPCSVSPESDSPVESPTSKVFPYLDTRELSDRQKFLLQCQLIKDSENVMSKFADFIHYTIVSLNANPVVTVKILSARLASLSAYKPVRAHKPLLQDQLEEIEEKCTTIDDVFFLLRKYYSFFNFGIIRRIITWFPTPDDEQRLEQYTEDFKEFCKRRTFECPPDIFGHTCESKSILIVKTEDNWDPHEETQGKVLDWVLKLQSVLAEILEVEAETLYICRIDKGCVELQFQVPSFVEEDIFPLSVEQERSLFTSKVAKLTCGSYSFPSKVSTHSPFSHVNPAADVYSMGNPVASDTIPQTTIQESPATARDWLRGWKEWARTRKRGKMAEFIVDKLQENKQARWLDVNHGKFELTEWHTIAEEWYRERPRNSDQVDAPLILRKGLPRAFPGLEEIESEGIKEWNQYKSRVFQAPPQLMQEVSLHMNKARLYPESHTVRGSGLEVSLSQRFEELAVYSPDAYSMGSPVAFDSSSPYQGYTIPHTTIQESLGEGVLPTWQFTGAQFTGAQLSDIGSDTWQRPPSMLSLSSRTPRSLDSFFSSSHSQFLPARSTKHSASVSAIVHAGRTHDVPRVKRHFSTSDVILKSSSYVLQSRSRYTSLPPMETYVSSSLSRESLPADKGKQKPATGPKPRKAPCDEQADPDQLLREQDL